jgi:hypothetical protein
MCREVIYKKNNFPASHSLIKPDKPFLKDISSHPGLLITTLFTP